MLKPIRKMNKKMKKPNTWVNIVDTFVAAKIQQKLNYRKRSKSFLMSLRKFFTFSALICGLFFTYLGTWGAEKPFWQKVFRLIEQSMDSNFPESLNWPQGFLSLGLILLLGNIGLYFFAKNWKLPLYLGIFVLLILLSLLMSTWILT